MLALSFAPVRDLRIFGVRNKFNAVAALDNTAVIQRLTAQDLQIFQFN
jgi:hypothetical protein